MNVHTLLFILAIPAVFAGIYVMRTAYAKHLGGPRCGACNTNLTGAESNRCPECGGMMIDVGVYPGPRGHRHPRFWLGGGIIIVSILLCFIVSSIVFMNQQIQMERDRAMEAMAAAEAAREQAMLAAELLATTQRAATTQAAE